MKSPLAIVLSTLWSFLRTRQRGIFITLTGVLLIAGIMEMLSVMLILDYIQGLTVAAEGVRKGKLTKLLLLLGLQTKLSQQGYVFYGGLFVLGFLLLKNLLATSVEFLLNRFLLRVAHRLSVKSFDRHLLSPLEQLDAQASVASVPKMFEVFSTCFLALTQVLADGLTLILVVGLLGFLDPSMALTAFLLFALVGGGTYRSVARATRELSLGERRSRRTANLFLRDGLVGIVETRLRDARGAMIRGYQQSLGQIAKTRAVVQAYRRLPKSVNELALGLLIVGTVWRIAAAGGTLEDALPILGVFAFAGLKLSGFATRVGNGMQKLRLWASNFQEHAAKLRSIELADETRGQDLGQQSYLDEEEQLPDGNDGKLHDALSLKDITYRYPGTDVDVLRGVSLTIKRGSFVGICGTSGSGKTTLVRVLLGLLRPSQGSVLCDHWNIFQHIRAWHRNIGYVSQDCYITDRNVRENVAFGVPDAQINRKRIWRALGLASAAEFVKELPRHSSTILQGGANSLSGGQRQRIAIARALYENPELILFDEATSALDNETERVISEAINGLKGKRTIVCVAHRLSTIRHCDAIFVMEKGRVVESGTYDDLYDADGAFRRLVDAGEVNNQRIRASRSASGN